jgi:hypothetical protein
MMVGLPVVFAVLAIDGQLAVVVGVPEFLRRLRVISIIVVPHRLIEKTRAAQQQNAPAEVQVHRLLEMTDVDLLFEDGLAGLLVEGHQVRLPPANRVLTGRRPALSASAAGLCVSTK